MGGGYKIGISPVITPALRRRQDNLQGDPPVPNILLNGSGGCRVVHLERGPKAKWAFHFLSISISILLSERFVSGDTHQALLDCEVIY